MIFVDIFTPLFSPWGTFLPLQPHCNSTLTEIYPTKITSKKLAITVPTYSRAHVGTMADQNPQCLIPDRKTSIKRLQELIC